MTLQSHYLQARFVWSNDMKKILNRSQLKFIALAFMIFDHIQIYLAGDVLPRWTTWLARFVALLFVYLLVEGFYKTTNRAAYLKRIIYAALLTWSGEILINLMWHHVDPITHHFTIYSLLSGNNILVTLALFLGIMWSLYSFQQNYKHWWYLCLTIILSLTSLIFEGGIYLLPLLFIFYCFYNKVNYQIIGILIICGLILAHAIYNAWLLHINLYEMLTFDNEWMMVTVIPFILLYNGQKGHVTFLTKHLFYVIYPVHLWILMITGYLLGTI